MPPASHRPSRLLLLSAAALLAASCSSGDQGGSSAGDGAKLASRISSKPSLDKRSQFEPTESSGDKKSFKAGAFSSREFKAKEFQGSKSYKTKSAREGDSRSPWAGLTSRESAQEAPSSLTGSYSTGDSRFSGQSSRDSGTTYGTGAYKTGEDIIGSNAIQDSAPPKMIQNTKTKRGMTESEIQSLLGKD